MENQTELNKIESNWESEVNAQDTQESLNSEPEIAEEVRIPEPWESAPEGLVYYEKMYPDGHLGSFTKSAKLAYKFGWFDNSIPEEDLEVSDVNGFYYPKELCPMKTEEDKFNEAKQNKLSELKKTADSALNGAYVVSSLGFKADANPAAVRDLEGLVIIGADSVMFCDYENNFHPLNKEQVLTLQREILLNGQNLYAQKWNYRVAVNAAKTVDELNAITFKFDMLDFSE